MYLFFFACVYWASSIQEWFFHKYCMHHKSYQVMDDLYNNHMAHHANTKKDYTIRNNKSEYICVDVFSSEGTLQMSILYSLNFGFFYSLFSRSVPLSIISTTLLGALMINILVWNVIHSYVHGFDSSKICSPLGISNYYVSEKNAIIRWLVENNRRHHDAPHTNYNIVFPGADYIFGTFYRPQPIQTMEK